MSTQTLKPECLHCLDTAPEILQFCTLAPSGETFKDPQKSQQWYQQCVKHLHDVKHTLEHWDQLDPTHQKGYLDQDPDRAHHLECLRLLMEIQ